MPQWMQGVMIGLLVSLLLGIVVGFYLRQRQVNRLTAALKTSQDREQVLQQEHESRLRNATAQLQQDYEAQLADKIERYQQQYDIQRQQLEAEYEARQNLSPGGPGRPSDTQAAPDAAAEAWETAPASEYEVRLRQQYEARLKEAAQKIQYAYEQHLRETLATEREAQQQEYDQRLAEAIARYQDEADERLAEALKEENLVARAEGSGLGTGLGDDTQIQERLATLEAELRRDYDRRLAERIEQYQDEMSQRLAQLEQDFAARLQMAQATQSAAELPPVVERPAETDLEAQLQAEYDQRLMDAVARHQDEMTERLQALEQDYEARLRMATAGDDTNREANLRQEIEAELRVEYGVQMAEKLEQVQADLNQRSQDFEAGLIATMDPFTDAAIDAEPLEDEGFGEEDLVGETLADETLVSESLADESLADETLVSENIVAETLADETLDEGLVADPFPDLAALPDDVPDESPAAEDVVVDPFADLDALPADSLVDLEPVPLPTADQATRPDPMEGAAGMADADADNLDLDDGMAGSASLESPDVESPDVESPGLEAADLQDFGFDLAALGESDAGESALGESALEDADWETSGLDESGLGDLDFEDSGLGDLDFEDSGLGHDDWEGDARVDDNLADGAFGEAGSDDLDFQVSESGDPNSGGGSSAPGPEGMVAELETAFNLDDLDLSALSDDDLSLNEGGAADIFNLETLAQQAGVDLGELNDLLNQTDAPTTDGESNGFNDEDWGSLS
ncbi:MAG: hypothetical protein VKI82_09200 [Leptolyngbya sp.]|nr:hypothetical protein [Leptolyngbya sp.]